MAQVMMPQKTKDDTLTTLMKGLTIASQVYGIKTNMAQLENLQADRENQDNLAAGKYNKSQQLALQKDFDVTPDKGEGSVEIYDSESGSPLYASVRKTKSPMIKEVATAKNGVKGTAFWDVMQNKELGFVPAAPDKVSTREVKTTDEAGNEIVQIVPDVAGQSFKGAPKTNPAEKKSEKEANYRYVSLKENAGKLKDLVKQYGTAELTGDASAKMDSLIYQMAVDYAKLVDPDSVAREGEVAAAQKYMLPIRDYGGLGTKNSTALGIVDNYVKDLDGRIGARQTAYGGGKLPEVSYKFEGKPTDGQAFAAPPPPPPKVGTVEAGYIFQGGDPADPKSWTKQ